MSRPAKRSYSFLAANLTGPIVKFRDRQAKPEPAQILAMPTDWANPIEPFFRLFPPDDGFTICQAVTINHEFYSIKTRERVSQTWFERQWRWDWLTSMLQGARGQVNQYVSQNSMDGHRGKGAKSIGLVWTDIDFYKVDAMRGLAPADAFPLIRDYLASKGLPTPTYAVDSGRGLYLKWLLKAAVPAKDHVSLQEALNRRIVAALREFGADEKAVDAKRVLRVCGSLHREGWIVRILPDSWTGALFEIEDLARRFRVETQRQQSVSPRADLVRKREWQAPVYTIHGKPVDLEPVYRPNRHHRSIRGYNAAVLEDIRALFHARGGLEAARKEGRRDAYAFTAAVFFALQDPQEARNQSLAFITELGLDAKEFGQMQATALARADRHLAGERNDYNGVSWDPRYTPKKATVLAWLGVTDEEAARLGLKALVPWSIKQQRAKAALTRKRRAAGVRPRSDYTAKADQARELAQSGLKPVDIAGQLGMTPAGVRMALRRSPWLSPLVGSECSRKGE